ncbi:Muscarinic acetylcholine receptor M5, partial [Corvus brachyrhynchos]
LSNSTVVNSSSINHKQLEGHSLWEVITIATVTAIVSLITIVGNILVMISFKVNSQLKTVNNYYLLSLACADLIIGIFSMNLYTSYILIGHWTLGSLACDLWLALDYVASNASVMNLLVISFDRYFSITRPLTYRAKRTPKRAGIMIGMAWLISFMLWAPVILCWQYFVGERTVPPEECQIQFLYEPIITFGTAIAAFYIPVSVMTILYCRIYKETEKRTKDLAELQGSESVAEFETIKPQKTLLNSYASSEDEDKLATDSVFQVTYKSPSKSKAEEYNETTDVVVKDQPEENDFENQKYFLSPAKEHVQKNKKCVAYKFRLVVKADGTQEANNGCRKVKISPCSAALSKDPSIKSMDPNINNQITKRKRMVLIKERKAAQTLSAILLAFIITWTPYNIMVLISTFCSDCIPVTLWHLGYWLCYVNSTVNPICYALCNKTFRKTFKMLLFCQWK